MKYIGNYFSWIDPLWEHKILTTEGQARPRDWPPAFATESEEYKRALEAGYKLTDIHWWVYEEQNLNLSILPPWISGDIHWWFTKLLPGQFMPIHTDPHAHEKPCKRYWIPLQDYVPGHVFIYNGDLVKDYLAGDVYQFDNSNDLHGAANIAHTPRIILQITEYV